MAVLPSVMFSIGEVPFLLSYTTRRSDRSIELAPALAGSGAAMGGVDKTCALGAGRLEKD